VKCACHMVDHDQSFARVRKQGPDWLLHQRRIRIARGSDAKKAALSTPLRLSLSKPRRRGAGCTRCSRWPGVAGGLRQAQPERGMVLGPEVRTATDSLRNDDSMKTSRAGAYHRARLSVERTCRADRSTAPLAHSNA
jgi:hypothetical protein